MNKKYAIGIDLGTSTSEICVYRDERPFVIPDPSSPTKSPVIPSIIAVNKRGELVVGEAARSYINLSGSGVREIKREMGSGRTIQLQGKNYRPEELSAVILRRLREIAEDLLGTTISECVISVPANFPDAARQATVNAGELAGLRVERLINEPTAAALAFGIDHVDLDEQVVVFDFGGGTLDVSILEMVEGVLDVKASYGDPKLGGKDIDEALLGLILKKFLGSNPGVEIPEQSIRFLKGQAESAKIALSSQHSHVVQARNFVVYKGEPIDLEVEVTRREFERAIAPILDRARQCTIQALEAKKVTPSAVDRIILVGGTTYIPAVRQMVAELFGKEPRSDVNPDLAVAMGASIQAALIHGMIDGEKGVILSDVSPFGLGVEIVGNVGGHWISNLYDPLIAPNTPIPYSTQKSYTLLDADQDTVKIRLFQDNKGTARVTDEAIYTGISGTIDNIPPSATGDPHPVEVEFSYDLSGLIRLSAVIPTTGQRLEISYNKSEMRLADDEKRVAEQRVRELWRMSAKARGYEGLIRKAERVATGLEPEKRSCLLQLVSELKRALEDDNADLIDNAGDRLTNFLFEIDDTI